VQLVETRVDMHSCSQLTMATLAASTSSLSGTSPSEAKGTSLTQGTVMLLHLEVLFQPRRRRHTILTASTSLNGPSSTKVSNEARKVIHMCNVDVSIAGGGVHQIERHCANKRHSNRVIGVSSQPTITELVGIQSDTRMLSDQVCHAEHCFARFVAEHNLPFAVADH
jgi:hypothetical protein